MLEDVADLLCIEPEVHRDQDAPEGADAEQAEQEARRVGRDDGDALVAGDAEVVEGGAEAARHLAEPGVGEAAEATAGRARLVDHGHPLAVHDLGALEKVPQRKRNDHRMKSSTPGGRPTVSMDWWEPPWHASGAMNGPLPLDGLRVLELGHIIAGPSAGLLLADLGADVIKVERPGEGDQTRGMPAGNGANFHFLNRNKRSITIDLKGSPEGRALFLRLARGSDIVIDNFAYGAVEGLGLGYDVLERENPRIIYMALKGFLPGPYEARPFLDELAQMSAGLAFMTGPRGQPMRAGASIVDVGAAAYGVIAVLAALQQRTQTGRGRRSPPVCTRRPCSGWASGWPTTAPPVSRRCRCRRSARARGWAGASTSSSPPRTASRSSSASRPTPTGSGSARSSASPTCWPTSGSTTTASAWPRAAWLPARIGEEMLKYPAAELAERLERAKIPFAPLRRPDQLVDDPHLNASEQWMATPLPGRPPAKLPKMPVRSSAYEFRLRRPAPQLGEHTREVLQEFGLSKDDIDALASRRVIG